MLLWELFLTFLRIGFVSFGGGYAVIPIIQYKVEQEHWMSSYQFQEVVSLAGMAPGPIATNTATLIGYHTYGIWGAIASTLGIILPSLLVIIILAGLFYRMNQNKWVKSSFYGLRPIIVGLIVYAAIHFGLTEMDRQSIGWTSIATLMLCAGAVFGILKFKLHPFIVILLSGVIGIVIF
ncbi:chromate transporter [Paenibacillus sp. LHD-38]|uniref:chromate transporter n=1 Tax=Paenibacillus sp. LHD-38 TaxID=3072143 RepID=UPI00280D9A95|nr:chromate transporter [Paenibacillus sp. LHD-38]MDQ8736479.1 chromate transporter [Paenibacillus sp. LHD-38]